MLLKAGECNLKRILTASLCHLGGKGRVHEDAGTTENARGWGLDWKGVAVKGASWLLLKAGECNLKSF